MCSLTCTNRDKRKTLDAGINRKGPRFIARKTADCYLVVEEKIHKFGLKSKGKWMAGLVLTGNVNLSPSTLLELASIRGACNKWFEEEPDVNGFCEVFGDQLVLLMTTSLENSDLSTRLDLLRSHILTINDQISPVFVIGSGEQELLLSTRAMKVQKSVPIVQYKSHLGGMYFSDQFRRETLLYGNLSPAEAHRLLTKLLPG